MQPPNSRIAKALCLNYEKIKSNENPEANSIQARMNFETYTSSENMLWCTQAFKNMQIRRDEDQPLPYNFMISYNRPDGVFGGYSGNISISKAGLA